MKAVRLKPALALALAAATFQQSLVSCGFFARKGAPSISRFLDEPPNSGDEDEDGKIGVVIHDSGFGHAKSGDRKNETHSWTDNPAEPDVKARLKENDSENQAEWKTDDTVDSKRDSMQNFIRAERHRDLFNNLNRGANHDEGDEPENPGSRNVEQELADKYRADIDPESAGVDPASRCSGCGRRSFEGDEAGSGGQTRGTFADLDNLQEQIDQNAAELERQSQEGDKASTDGREATSEATAKIKKRHNRSVDAINAARPGSVPPTKHPFRSSGQTAQGQAVREMARRWERAQQKPANTFTNDSLGNLIDGFIQSADASASMGKQSQARSTLSHANRLITLTENGDLLPQMTFRPGYDPTADNSLTPTQQGQVQTARTGLGMYNAAQEFEDTDPGLAAFFRDHAGTIMDIAVEVGFEAAKSVLGAVPNFALETTEALTGKRVTLDADLNLVVEEMTSTEQAVAIVSVSVQIGLAIATGTGSVIIIGMVRGVAKGAKKGMPEVIEGGAKLAQKTTKAKNATIKANKIAKNAESLGVEAKDLAGLTKEIDRLVPDQVDDIYEAAAKNKPLGLGSTGRTEPRDLREQAAMLVTRADPDKGMHIEDLKLNRGPWQHADGWEKWQTVFEVKGEMTRRNITIHYVKNKHTGAVDDFKFKD